MENLHSARDIKKKKKKIHKILKFLFMIHFSNDIRKDINLHK